MRDDYCFVNIANLEILAAFGLEDKVVLQRSPCNEKQIRRVRHRVTENWTDSTLKCPAECRSAINTQQVILR